MQVKLSISSHVKCYCIQHTIANFNEDGTTYIEGEFSHLDSKTGKVSGKFKGRVNSKEVYGTIESGLRNTWALS